ncbi:unnamed protein product [Rotaria sordida]|uniref:Uncharacterized protein n=2 Tax=Rotaria sordida TaxID=392033 RepID=A0A814WWN3_9BILA|nr:unnamed protein product [Rotaria sordida]
MLVSTSMSNPTVSSTPISATAKRGPNDTSGISDSNMQVRPQNHQTTRIFTSSNTPNKRHRGANPLRSNQVEMINGEQQQNGLEFQNHYEVTNGIEPVAIDKFNYTLIYEAFFGGIAAFRSPDILARYKLIRTYDHVAAELNPHGVRILMSKYDYNLDGINTTNYILHNIVFYKLFTLINVTLPGEPFEHIHTRLNIKNKK